MSSLLFLAGLFLMAAAQAQEPCQRIGRVAAADMGCGARVVDLKDGQLLQVVSSSAALPVGRVFGFSATSAMPPASCPPTALPAVALTCLTDTLPCEADFTATISPQNALRLSFEAVVFDPDNQRCQWNFSDGATAEGVSVQHTFSQEGYYVVCLTLTDSMGCHTQRCRSVWVGATNATTCGYEAQVVAVGLKMHAQLVPLGVLAPPLKSVRWFMAKTGATLAEAQAFTAMLPGAGTYHICAQYETETPACSTTRCQLVSVATSQCYQQLLAKLMATQVCPSLYSPVCGCDGVTYPNECAAMAAGVTQWWVGECGASGGGNCAADIRSEVVAGSPTTGYWMRFHNRSNGPYHVVQIDFGDGSPLWIGSALDTIVEHYYAKGGPYRVNLTIWRNNQCVSSVEHIVAPDATSWQTANGGSLLTDYVFPGDANGDRKANVYDVLQLGLGFTRSGPPRPFATTAWAPQFAPNWPSADVSTVNFKHADTDGNGVINEFDRGAIEKNYKPIEFPEPMPSAEGSVPVWLRFSQDSIVVSPQNPGPIVISADIRVGKVDKPVYQLYGLAFALKYPDYIAHDPELFYSNNAFLGAPGDVMLLSKDIYSHRQMDLGLARKNSQAVSGYGTIATIKFSTDFVIIIDVIERTGSLRIPFTVPVVGVRGINAKGEPLVLHGAVLDTLWLVLQQSVSTEEVQDANAIEVIVFPNPTSADVWVAASNTSLERVEVFDLLGRMVESHRSAGVHTTHIRTHAWSKGLYTLRIYTSEGVVERRLVVH